MFLVLCMDVLLYFILSCLFNFIYSMCTVNMMLALETNLVSSHLSMEPIDVTKCVHTDHKSEIKSHCASCI